MIPAPVPFNEDARLAALLGLRLLDTPNETAFDDLVQLASQITGCPISLVSLVDRDRQWFKARHGLTATETPREPSFCGHAIMQPGVMLEVADTYSDERFVDNPLVTGGPRIRFYAGVPLVTPAGLVIGTLCVIDSVPKKLSPEQCDSLRRLARQVESQIELRVLVAESKLLAKEAASAQSAWQASEIRFRAMSDASPLGIYVTDANGSATYLNPKWLEFADMPSDLALGNGWVEAIHPDDRERVSKTWCAAASERRPFISEHRFKRANGTEIWTRARAAEMLSHDGQVIGFVGTVEDISDSKLHEVELTRARDEALQAMRSKADFLATMSHEIRTPMNGVIGMTGLLMGSDLHDSQREYVQIIQQCSDSLLVLINDILDFSKIEAGALSLENTTFDPLQIIDESVGLLAERAQAKGLDLVVCVDPGLPLYITGDPGRLRQILVNLLGNAVKFTEKGTVKVTVFERDDRLCINVIDSGIGMDPDVLAGLFKPFTQADASTSRRFGGTGLGLAICKRLTELMGGTITVTSIAGTGSTFALAMPAPKPEQRGQRPAVNLNGAAIALSPSLRPGIEAWITAWGGRVVDLSVPAAVSFVDRRQPEVTEVSSGPDPRRVLVTGLSDRLTNTQVDALGIAACLTRPLRIAAVLDVLHRVVLRSHQSARQGVAHDRDMPQFSGRVLVADDNPVNVKVAVALLRKIGIHADATANGIEALVALDTMPYDLALMDCQMPELDGFAATAELRRRETAKSLKRVPVIALTANAMPGDRERCLKAGMDDYLAKPIRLESLIAMVRGYLPEKATAPEASSPIRKSISDGNSGLQTPDKGPRPPDFDPEPIARLLIDLDDPTGAILPELESGFQAQALAQLAELGIDMASNNLPRIANNAHALKGQALTLGLLALADAVINLERFAKSGDAAACRQLIPLLPEIFDRAQAALGARIHG